MGGPNSQLMGAGSSARPLSQTPYTPPPQTGNGILQQITGLANQQQPLQAYGGPVGGMQQTTPQALASAVSQAWPSWAGNPITGSSRK